MYPRPSRKRSRQLMCAGVPQLRKDRDLASSDQPSSRVKGRALSRASLGLIVAVVALLAVASPALADSFAADANGWFNYGYPQQLNGETWYPSYRGSLIDQDSGTAGTQIMMANSKPVKAICLWARYYTGNYVNVFFPYNNENSPIPTSSTPRLVTMMNGIVSYLCVQGSTEQERYNYADQLFHDGYWVFTYTDNTTCTVDVDPGFLNVLGRWFLCNFTTDPVNTSTGNATYSVTDLSLPGKGLGIAFTRTYNSQDGATNGPLGYGWNHSYQTRLLVLSSSDPVTLVYPDGHRAVFQKQTDGSYKQPLATSELLVKNANGTFTVTSSDQTTLGFSSTGRLESLADLYGSQTTLTYDGNGLLTQVADPGGRSLTLSYSGARISSITDSASRSVDYGYDGNGNLSTVSDPNGHTTTYTYDSLHQLTSIQQPESSANPLITNTYAGDRVTEQTDALGSDTELSYNSTLGQTGVTDNNGHTSTDTWDPESFRVTKHTDPYNYFSTFAYDWRGWLSASTDENGHTSGYAYDPKGNITATVDAEGHATRAGYDAKSNPLYIQDALGERLTRMSSGLIGRDEFTSDTLSNYTIKPEASAGVWQAGYDSNYLFRGSGYSGASSVARTGWTGASCVTCRMYMNSNSNEICLYLADSFDTGYLYNSYFNQLYNPGTGLNLYRRSGGTSTWLAFVAMPASGGHYYNQRVVDAGSTVYALSGKTSLGSLATKTGESTFGPGFPVVSCSTAGYKCDWLEARTSHLITCSGLPSGYKFEVSDGTTTVVATESGGTATVDAKAVLFPLAQVRVLNASNQEVANLTSATLSDMGGGDAFAYDNSVGHRAAFSWDATGTFLNSVSSPTGTTSFAWNTDGSLDSVTDAENRTWEYGYNAYGDLVSVLDPLDYETTYDYDDVGRVTNIEDANSSLIQFTYDDKGNVTAIKDPLAETDPQNRHQIDITYDDNDNVAAITDARGNTTAFTYDDMNHLSLVEDALSGEALFGYDDNYNLETSEDPNGHTTTYAYDYNDRLTSVTDPLSEVTEYDYDPVGNLASITYPSADETSFTYTDDNLLEEISHSGSATTYTYSYNPTNTVSQVERNDNATWSYSYDEANRLTSESDENNSELGTLTIERDYDNVSNLTGLDIGVSVSLSLTYDARNLVASLTDPGGTSTFTHDDGGRLTEIATPEGSTRSLTYDAAGRPTEVENVTDSGTQTLTYTYDANGNVTSEGSTTYTYDALNRLTSWYDPIADVTTEYTYDAGGNLTTVEEDSVPTESYTHNAGNQITNTGYAYDDNGNLTADGTYTYVYDADNQLIEVKEGETTTCQMTYDHIGRRTSLTTGGATTFFHYAGGLPVAESDENGDITATYAYAPEGGLISMTRGEDTYYYQTNAHGDVVSLTDGTGAVVNSYTYDPWGKVLSEAETVENPFRYASYHYDEETGLYYLWHRYYDPELRRFLTPDLVFGSIYDPACLNCYLYVFDNPVSLADPSGLLGIHVSPRVTEEALGGVDRLWELAMGPLEDLAQEALEWYVAKAETANFAIKPLLWIGGGLSALMTHENSWATMTILGVGGSWAQGLSREASTTAKAGTCPEAAEAARITFGHGSRHLSGNALDANIVESAIESQIQQSVSRATSVSGSFWGRVTIEGQIVEYRAFGLADRTINVGTYYVIP